MAIANTIAEARPTGITDWLLHVVQDPAYGEARQMLPLAVARMVSPQTANDVLLSIYDQLPGHVALSLGESGGERELKFLRDKRDRYKGWIRKEIKPSVLYQEDCIPHLNIPTRSPDSDAYCF
jgi:hypothetical protein